MASAAALLLCDLVYSDHRTGNITLLGIFTAIRPSRFPSPTRAISAYALLEGTPAEPGELVLECVEEQTGQSQFRDSQRTQIGLNGKLHIHMRFGEAFSFPRPGRYLFTLTFNGELVAEQTIILQEVS
jgi:hypothetical protein